MVRTQVQFEEQQYERLKRMAVQRGVSLSQLVREGADHLLTVGNRDERWSRLLEVAGRSRDRDGRDDVAQRHDEYLLEVWENE